MRTMIDYICWAGTAKHRFWCLQLTLSVVGAEGCGLGRVNVAGWVWMGRSLDWLRDLFCGRQCGVSSRAQMAFDSRGTDRCLQRWEYCLDGLAIVFGEKLPVNIQKKMADFSRSSVPLPFAYLLGACLDFANVGTCIIKG
jgi:hypothetical protein